VQVGVSASNIMDGNSAPELARQLLEARLESEFRRPSPHSISESQVERDWNLLNQAASQSDVRLTARSASSVEIRENQQ
jgi:hypothetical protein